MVLKSNWILKSTGTGYGLHLVPIARPPGFLFRIAAGVVIRPPNRLLSPEILLPSAAKDLLTY